MKTLRHRKLSTWLKVTQLVCEPGFEPGFNPGGLAAVCTLSLYTVLDFSRTNAQCGCTCPTLASHKLRVLFPAVPPTSAHCVKNWAHTSYPTWALPCNECHGPILPGAPHPQEVTCPLLPQLLCIYDHCHGPGYTVSSLPLDFPQ